MRFGRTGRALAAGIVTALALAACGGGPGDRSGPSKGPEKNTLNVGVVPVPDAAPLFIAMRKGFFRQEGLDVRPQVITASPQATPRLVNGSMDLALLNYVATFVAQDKGAAKFKLIADSYQGANNSFAVLAGKNSGITTPADLKGKKVAVAAVKSITHLLMTAALSKYGLKESDVKAVPVPLPNMEAALKQGSVDAVAAVEPFVTSNQKKIGARNVLDLVAGPTREFPIAGWGGTDRWVAKNPKTVAAFQRAVGRAAKIAATDRAEVTKVIPTYTKIPAPAASAITLGTYPAPLDQRRMQRVADVLARFNYTKGKVDVRQMVVASPPG